LYILFKTEYKFIYKGNRENQTTFHACNRILFITGKIFKTTTIRGPMKNVLITGGVTAIVTGVFIGIQSMFSGRAGELIGPINTGFWTNFLGGCLAGLLILGIGSLKGFGNVSIARPALGMVLLSGALGIFIIMGVSFSISRVGLAAGMAAGEVWNPFRWTHAASSDWQ
jgi:hypothetical protein